MVGEVADALDATLGVMEIYAVRLRVLVVQLVQETVGAGLLAAHAVDLDAVDLQICVDCHAFLQYGSASEQLWAERAERQLAGVKVRRVRSRLT